MRVAVKFSESEHCVAVRIAESDHHVTVNISEVDRAMDVNFGQIQAVTEYVGGEPYQGEYTATPSVEGQTIPTKNKVMLDDLTVRAIPVYEVSNESGGNTVYIAKEV